MLDHVLNLRFVQGIVPKVHHSIANDQTFQVDVVLDRPFVVSQYPHSHIRHVFSSVTLTR